MNKMLLPRSSASKNVCSVCEKYLSVAPIHILENKYICGRCLSAGTRDMAYEEVAQYLRFPCVNENCNLNLAWGTVEEHERECLHRRIRCPIVDCQLLYELNTLQTHFEEFHKGCTYRNELTLPECKMSDLDTSQKNVFLLLHNLYAYLVFISRTQEKRQDFIELVHEFAVFLVQKQSSDIKYEVTLTFKTDGKSIATTTSTQTNQEVQFFNEKIHILDEIQAISVTKFETLHKNDNVSLALDLKVCDPGFSMPVKVCDNLTHSFECPICYMVMSGLVYLCAKGHSICQTCKFKIQSCPYCQSKFLPDCRNYLLEEIIASGKPQKKNFKVTNNGYPFAGFSLNQPSTLFVSSKFQPPNSGSTK